MKNKQCKCFRTITRYDWGPLFHKNTERAVTVCAGTRELDECHCKGDRKMCTFYPEIRERATIEETMEVDAKVGREMRWRPVDTDPPKRIGRYLVFTCNGWIAIAEFYDRYGDGEMQFDDNTVTHWMPLPEVPETPN